MNGEKEVIATEKEIGFAKFSKPNLEISETDHG